MLSVKQIETFYWVAKLGTVQRAADTLHITQSAATKRLQDLEAKSAAPLFEGGGKKARLSAKGHEMLTLCEGLLESIGRLEAYRDADRRMTRVLHIGLTELVALTWFPAFLQQMREMFSLRGQTDRDLDAFYRRPSNAFQIDVIARRLAVLAHRLERS